MAKVLTVYHIMSRILRRKKRGPVRSKKKVVDGIEFKSGLEAYMYKALKEAKIQAKYEGISYQLIPSFDFNNLSYERQSNGKGEYKNRSGKKIRGITYTPDFTGRGFIIECKGRPNESFPIRWKLFKMYASRKLPKVNIYKPQNQKECDETVSLILGNRKT